MKKLSWEDLGISNYGIIHIDNTTRKDLYISFKTWCGMSEDAKIYPLNKINRHYNLKLCKKCSNIYYNKYKENFSEYIIILKLKDKLFI